MERLCRDVHPAEVVLPDGSVERAARVFVTTERFQVWRRSPYGVELKWTAKLMAPGSVSASRGSLNGAVLLVQTDRGCVFVNRGAGCGCGSPLLALAPPVGWAG